MTRAFMLAALLAVCSLGCGGSSSGGGDGGDTCAAGTVLDVHPDSIDVQAGTARIEIWGGFSTACQAMVDFTLSGPGTLSPTSGIPVYYTPPASVAAVTTGRITATGGGLTDVIPITIRP